MGISEDVRAGASLLRTFVAQSNQIPSRATVPGVGLRLLSWSAFAGVSDLDWANVSDQLQLPVSQAGT